MTPTRPAPDALRLGMRLLCLAIILTSVLRVGWSAVHWDATYDEYWHLLWSERALLEGNFEREYSNFVSTTPVTMLNAGARELSSMAGYTDGQQRTAASRLPTVAGWVLLLALVYGLGRRLAGPEAGLLASTLTALDPNLATHGALATVDIYFAIVTLAFVYQSVRFLQSPGMRDAMLLAAILGTAFVVKLTTVLFLPVLLLVLVLGVARKGAEQFIPTLTLYSVVGTAVASLIVNLAYQYQDVGFFLKDITLYSSFMLGLQKELPWLFLLLPRSFIEGFDQTLSFELVMSWNTVIFDQYLTNGAWYYFPVTWFFKTPVAVLALVLIAAVLGIRQLRAGTQTSATLQTALWLMGLQWLIFLLYFNFVFRTHVGLRYILMCLPILYLFTAVALCHGPQRRWLPVLLPVALVIAVLEHLPFAGNALSFSNAFLPDKKNAWYVLTDSNIDWGQNYTQVFAQADAEYPDAVRNPAHIMPGQNLIRLNYLTGVFRNFEQYRWVRENLAPVHHLQHTHLLYEVTDVQFEQFVNEQNTAAPVPSLDVCNGNVASTLPWQFEAQSTGDQPLCLDAGNGLYSIRITRGWGVAGRFENGSCTGYPLETGKQAIFKVDAARGLLCLSSNEVGTVWEVSRRD